MVRLFSSVPFSVKSSPQRQVEGKTLTKLDGGVGSSDQVCKIEAEKTRNRASCTGRSEVLTQNPSVMHYFYFFCLFD